MSVVRALGTVATPSPCCIPRGSIGLEASIFFFFNVKIIVVFPQFRASVVRLVVQKIKSCQSELLCPLL